MQAVRTGNRIQRDPLDVIEPWERNASRWRILPPSMIFSVSYPVRNPLPGSGT